MAESTKTRVRKLSGNAKNCKEKVKREPFIARRRNKASDCAELDATLPKNVTC